MNFPPSEITPLGPVTPASGPLPVAGGSEAPAGGAAAAKAPLIPLPDASPGPAAAAPQTTVELSSGIKEALANLADRLNAQNQIIENLPLPVAAAVRQAFAQFPAKAADPASLPGMAELLHSQKAAAAALANLAEELTTAARLASLLSAGAAGAALARLAAYLGPAGLAAAWQELEAAFGAQAGAPSGPPSGPASQPLSEPDPASRSPSPASLLDRLLDAAGLTGPEREALPRELACLFALEDLTDAQEAQEAMAAAKSAQPEANAEKTAEAMGAAEKAERPPLVAAPTTNAAAAAILKAAAAAKWRDLLPPGDLARAAETVRHLAREAARPASQPFAETGPGNMVLAFTVLFSPDGGPPRPAHFHVYRQAEQDRQGKRQPGETWLRVLVHTENIGLVESVFHLYGERNLDIKVLFPADDAAAAFAEHLPDIRKAVAGHFEAAFFVRST